MTSSDFERLNQYLLKRFNDDNDIHKSDIMELLKKHSSSVNHIYTEKIRELFGYFSQPPPYKPPAIRYTPNIYTKYSVDTVDTVDTVLTKEVFFNMYITTKLREIFYFDIEYEKNLAKPRGSPCSLRSLRSLRFTQCFHYINVFKCYHNECHDVKEQQRLYNIFITELKGLMDKEACEAHGAHGAHGANENKDDKNKTNESSKRKKKKAISATVKRLVWNTNIGEDIGKAKCMCCKTTDITQLSFHCGHILAEANGGETIVSNLKPICQNCNSSMGTKNMNDFMESLK